MKPFLKGKKKKRRLQRRDYSVYRFSAGQYLGYGITGAGIGLIVCWLCYHSIYALPIAFITAVIYLRSKNRELREKRKNTMLYHFKDLLGSMHTSLCSGYSVENAVKSSIEDMRKLYGEEDVITDELRIMLAGIKLRKPVEELFEDLAERSDLDDIRLFSQLLTVSKRHGGSIGKVLSDTKRLINEKIETQMEIEKVLASKIYEQKIMSLMPAAVIIYLRLTFSGFIEQMYGNIAGVIIMTGCLTIYAAAYFMGKKIVGAVKKKV